MEGGGVAGRREEEDDESEVRRLDLHGIPVTLIWCLVWSMCEERVDGVQRGRLQGYIFSVARVSEKVGARQSMLYLQLLKARGAYRRVRRGDISFLNRMQFSSFTVGDKMSESPMLGTSVVESKAKAECRLTHKSNGLPFPAGVW